MSKCLTEQSLPLFRSASFNVCRVQILINKSLTVCHRLSENWGASLSLIVLTFHRLWLKSWTKGKQRFFCLRLEALLAPIMFTVSILLRLVLRNMNLEKIEHYKVIFVSQINPKPTARSPKSKPSPSNRLASISLNQTGGSFRLVFTGFKHYIRRFSRSRSALTLDNDNTKSGLPETKFWNSLGCKLTDLPYGNA